MRRASGVCGLSRRRASTARTLIGLVVAAVVSAVIPGQAAGVPPAPPNQSDSDISGADDGVNRQLGTVGELINQVAAATQQLAQIDDDVAAKREQVNKTLVDT